jgi:hypothetical protein
MQQKAKYRREDPEIKPLPPSPQTVTDTPPATTKKVKYGQIGAPGSQKRKDWLNKIRAKHRSRQKVVKEKVEEKIAIIEEVAVKLEDDKPEVDRPEPAPIKEALKEKGPPIEKDYVEYPY